MSIAVTDMIFQGDLVIDTIKGDWKVDFSDQQHIRDIYTLDLGQAWQFPLLGLGVIRDLNGSPNLVALAGRVRRMLIYDNYKVLSLKATPGMRVKNSVTP